MQTDAPQMYQEYMRQRGDVLGLFELLNERYKVGSVLYPGSYIHITPSFVFPDVTYVDSFKKTRIFFADDEGVADLVKRHKQYKEESTITFHYADYTKDFGEKGKKFDLLVSLYAGFVSQACKKYLKRGGILTVNNSHGDAGMASVDRDFEFIAAITHHNEKYRLLESDLDSYFIPRKKGLKTTKRYLADIGRGVGYTKTADVYVFRRK